ncbi:MAG: folate-binding protein [Mariprofundaceae bacterium]
MSESTQLNCLRSSLTVLKASGESIKAYLQGQITQDIQKLETQKSIYTAVLTPQGKMIADVYITEADGELLLITQSFCASALLERLRRFSLGHQVEFKIAEDLAVISMQGEGSEATVSDLKLPSLACIEVCEAAATGYWLMMPRTSVEAALSSLPEVCSEEDMNQARMSYGRASFGLDWDASTFPLNANLIEMNGVSFDKGCYVGQEVTSRMQWRGGIKKRFYHVTMTGPLPSSLPCPILTSIKIGLLTSATTLAEQSYQGIAHLSIETVELNKALKLENDTEVTILGPCHD